MPFFAVLKRSLTKSQTREVSNEPQPTSQKANLARLPDELLEIIINALSQTRDVTNLRLSSKRLALLTTHLIAAHCPTNRACVNATESLKTLVAGSRVPLLNGTTTSLTLSAESWKSPVPSSYGGAGAGLREVHLLRLTSLRLCSMRVVEGSGLVRFLASHASTLKAIHIRHVHAPDLPSWRAVLVRVAKMHRLQLVELRHLLYSVGVDQELVYLLPRSTYCTLARALDRLESSHDAPPEEERKVGGIYALGRDDDPVVARGPKAIGRLLDEFFTDTGELQKDFSHLQHLAEDEKEGWAGKVKRRILRVGG